jgi:hypothetical protein
VPEDVRKMVYCLVIHPFQEASRNTVEINVTSGDFHHPYRNRNDIHIAVEVEAVRRSGDFDHRHLTGVDYTTLCSLSKVNRQIRDEFAQVFWSNAAVYVSYDDGMLLPVRFLKDRPSICPHLKSFFMILDWSYKMRHTGMLRRVPTLPIILILGSLECTYTRLAPLPAK